MSTVPGYEGPAHAFSTPIEALTAICTASYNHRAARIRNCKSAFHLASTILGGHDIIEEFTTAQVWSVSYGWAPTEIVNFNVNWAAQEVPFPRFGLQLRDGQSANEFMIEVERKVNAMIGEYTMNEYKEYKNLVKHKRRINRVFSEICGDKSFRSRRKFWYNKSLEEVHLMIAFNKSLGTSYRGELLSVGYEKIDARGGSSKLLTLWNSSKIMGETGEGNSEQRSLPLIGTPEDLPSTSSGLAPPSQVTVEMLSRKGS
jgi:hypothetical protein